MEGYIDLRDRIPLFVRQHQQEPMPIVPQPDLVQEARPEALHGVHVGDGDPEELVAQPVVQGRDESLLVPPHFPARDHVPPFLKSLEIPWYLLRKVLEVGIEEDDPASICGSRSGE